MGEAKNSFICLIKLFVNLGATAVSGDLVAIMALSLALGGVKLIQPSSGGSRRPLHIFTRFLHENPNRYQTCAVIPKSHDFSLTSFRHYQNSIHLTPPPHALLTLSRDDPRRRWFASTSSSSSSSSSEKPPKMIRDDD